jgi:hypothetical protein
MKLRIYDDSIRLRLTQSEVAQIARGMAVESVCRFPGGAALTYTLMVADTPAIDARFAGERIEVVIPRDRATQWATGIDVALRSERRHNSVLDILVEKDFACLEPRDADDDTDRYPNPHAQPKA